LAKIDTSGVERNKKIDGKEAFDMLMVGSPAGAAAAVYAARRAFTVVVKTLAARRFGYAGHENYISVKRQTVCWRLEA
jgi:alkyl hydroperoxide reductase subunit AhpF